MQKATLNCIFCQQTKRVKGAELKEKLNSSVENR